MYKALKRERRARKREAELAADRAVTEATATGSPMRIDDETQGIPLVSTSKGAFAGELINPRGCYICKNDYTLVDAFYHYLCPTCAAFSHSKRDQRTDLTGKRALLTGGRAKIGMSGNRWCSIWCDRLPDMMWNSLPPVMFAEPSSCR